MKIDVCVVLLAVQLALCTAAPTLQPSQTTSQPKDPIIRCLLLHGAGMRIPDKLVKKRYELLDEIHAAGLLPSDGGESLAEFSESVLGAKGLLLASARKGTAGLKKNFNQFAKTSDFIGKVYWHQHMVKPNPSGEEQRAKTMVSAERCDVVFAMFVPTKTSGWNPQTQQMYCRALALIKPVMFVCHSMCNLIIGSAIHAGREPGCANVGRQGGPLWFESQGPIRGTFGADFLEEVFCPLLSRHATAEQKAEKERLLRSSSLLGGFIQGKVGKIFCEEGDTRGHAAYRSLTRSRVRRGLPQFPEDRVAGSMCGLTPTSLTVLSKEALGLEEINKVIAESASEATKLMKIKEVPADWTTIGRDGYTADPPRGTDGLVGFSECRITGKTYERHPRSRFYAACINHNDGAGVKGDKNSIWGDAKQGCELETMQPLRWQANMAAIARGVHEAGH